MLLINEVGHITPKKLMEKPVVLNHAINDFQTLELYYIWDVINTFIFKIIIKIEKLFVSRNFSITKSIFMCKYFFMLIGKFIFYKIIYIFKDKWYLIYYWHKLNKYFKNCDYVHCNFSTYTIINRWIKINSMLWP